MIPSRFQSIVRRAPCVVLDTNVALLLVVGRANPEYIERHRRTAPHFVHDDLLQLEELLGMCAAIATTPHVLAELSNLLGRWEGARKVLLSSFLPSQELWPRLIEAAPRVETEVFLRLGLTDWGLRHLRKEGIVLISTDLTLCVEVERAGGRTVRFNQLRSTE